MRLHEHRHDFPKYEPKEYSLEFQREAFEDMRERQEPSYPMVWIVISFLTGCALVVCMIVKRFFI